MIETTILDNGLTVMTQNIPESKNCTIGYVVKSGSYHENDDERGMAHVVEHMLFKGTINRDYKQIHKDIESVGGYLNACTSFEYTKYHCIMPKDQWEIGLEVISDMIFNHTIPEEELVKEKEVIKEEIKMYEDDPSSLVCETLIRNMFKKYKNRQSIAGTVESVDAFTRDGILNFIERNYFPQNMVLLSVGNINHEQVVNYIKAYMNKLNIRFNQYQLEFEPFKFETTKEEIVKLKKQDISQSHIEVGFFGPGYKDNDLVPLDVLATILGGNSSSLLFDKIREEKGLAYSIGMSLEIMSDVSVATIYGGLNSKSDVMPEIKDIVYNAMDNIDKNMLESAKQYCVGISEISLESTSAIHDYLVNKIINNDTKTFEEDMEDIKKVTMEDIKRVAEKYLNSENIYIVKLN